MKNSAVATTWLIFSLFIEIASAQSTDDRVDFNRDIRPILAEACFQCHGPDKNQRKADLRMDEQEGLLGTADAPGVVVSGKPAESELFSRLITDDEETRMPPADSGRSLNKKQIALIKKWIEQGAKWKGHWSYITPTPVTPPETRKSPFIQNEIDRFIVEKLTQKGLKHSPSADRVTLIRRLSFDFIGLPPSPKEVSNFVNDKSPKAYEKLIDQLLSSPHYGERMAIHWLDLVRYADTNGYHGDNHRDLWAYRDYVINAFNSNKPFNQFTIEQLAGDLLPEPSQEEKIASGYNRLLMTTREGGAQAKEYLAKYTADRVRNVSTVWMGSTMMCSECHDHKYDPFTMKDFYSLASFFADIKETAVGKQQPGLQVPDDEYKQALKAIEDRLAELKTKLETPTPKLTAAREKWEKGILANLDTNRFSWIPVKPHKVESQDALTLTVQDDLSVLASAKDPATATYTVSINTELENITGIKLDALTHKSFKNGGLSQSAANFVLTEFETEMTSVDNLEPERVEFASAIADYSQKNFEVAKAIDGKPNTGWAVDGATKKKENRQAVFTFKKPIAGGPGTTLTIRLKHESSFPKHLIGRFRLSLTRAIKPLLDKDQIPAELVEIIKSPAQKRTTEQQEQLAKYHRDVAPELDGLRKQIAATEKQRTAKMAAVPTTLVSVSVKPRMMRILPRGNWLDDSGEEVQPAVPAFLPELKSAAQRSSRLDLANWFVDSKNPIVARVFVNRLWQMMFGQGIVKTLDDFGSQGAWPTHPELLDWLALEFIESGWDIKYLLKLMAMSGTYQQSSHSNASLREVDPSNSWLARQGRYRLSAEMIRDNALSVSGLLVKKMGGRSVKPYQPPGYWVHLNFPKRAYQNDTGENQYRRGVYTYWCRTFLHPSLKAFDASTREECVVERPRSNTPLQALVLLNDPSYVEASRALAERILREAGDTAEQRIQFSIQEVLSRSTRPEELELLTTLYNKHLKQYQSDSAAAEKLLNVGQRPVPANLDKAELAAWTSIARVILNLHETISRY